MPWVSILDAAVIGCIGFGPFPSWNAFVGAVTGATAVMCAIASIALAALGRAIRNRPRAYLVPMPSGCCWPPSAPPTSSSTGAVSRAVKVIGALVLGLLVFAIGSSRAGTDRMEMMKHALWIAPWLGGHLVIGALGRYGDTPRTILPDWVDMILVIAFSLVIAFGLLIFSWSVSLRLAPAQVQEQVARDAYQLDYEAAGS